MTNWDVFKAETEVWMNGIADARSTKENYFNGYVFQIGKARITVESESQVASPFYYFKMIVSESSLSYPREIINGDKKHILKEMERVYLEYSKNK